MKQKIITLMLTMVMWSAIVIAAGATTAPADSISATPTATTVADEVEAYSDTTSVDTAGGARRSAPDDWEEQEEADVATLINNSLRISGGDISGGDIAGMLFASVVLLIIFVLAPVLLIGVVLYFVYKNRKQRLHIAEMAMRSGQPIPLDALGNPVSNNDALWNKGIKQVFLGAGLAILLWVVIGKLGMAIGALIVLMGCGNLVIARQAREKQRQKDMYDHMFGNGNAQ